ncbi:MAG: oxygen-independent coproporphyrinogen III oxidase [Nonlabens sp.]
MKVFDPQLVAKYNVAGPRYTSYPTVPYWDKATFSTDGWLDSLNIHADKASPNEISLYIHLPFCESICTFCGCTKRITKNHTLEIPYINAVLKELQLYLDQLSFQPVIKQIHLGGGTPTFFSPYNLGKLLDGVFAFAEATSKKSFSFEGHPNSTSKEHLELLKSYGFNRVCYGVQDYNETVQKAINRIQPFEHVQQATQMARDAGYESVGHDVIYGLPFQNLEHVIHTINQTITLRPDRIAFYSYAHVPWIKGNGQRGYDEKDLPTAKIKRKQYEIGKQLLLEAGYVEIGMDHFALPTDELYNSMTKATLHRNFMGYTSSKTDVMLGLGVSAIGDSWYGFAQNVKTLKEYYELVRNDQIPLMRGHLLNKEDLIIRKHILNLMCRFETSWDDRKNRFPEIPDVLIQLKELEKDGLVELYHNRIIVTDSGKPFIRNICMPFDLRLQRKLPKVKLFSMTV